MRLVAMLRWQDALAERLAQARWVVYDLDFARMCAVRDFDGAAAARAAAARDLPAGVPVGHSCGGFVVGHDGLAPPPGGVVPAYVLWPDGEERLVETHEELAAALRERPEWRERAVVEPVARLRWDGFRHGWQGSEARPAEERRHPIHYEFDGAFTQVWRDGLRAGAEAARSHLTAQERVALAPESTEQDLRDRRIDDPGVRAWRREVDADVRGRLREAQRAHEEGNAAAARAALAALHGRLLSEIGAAEADERPAAAKLAVALRRIASSAARAAGELASERA